MCPTKTTTKITPQKKEIRGVMNDMCPLKTTTKVRGKKKERRGVRIEPIRHYIVDIRRGRLCRVHRNGRLHATARGRQQVLPGAVVACSC